MVTLWKGLCAEITEVECFWVVAESADGTSEVGLPWHSYFIVKTLVSAKLQIWTAGKETWPKSIRFCISPHQVQSHFEDALKESRLLAARGWVGFDHFRTWDAVSPWNNSCTCTRAVALNRNITESDWHFIAVLVHESTTTKCVKICDEILAQGPQASLHRALSTQLAWTWLAVHLHGLLWGWRSLESYRVCQEAWSTSQA